MSLMICWKRLPRLQSPPTFSMLISMISFLFTFQHSKILFFGMVLYVSRTHALHLIIKSRNISIFFYLQLWRKERKNRQNIFRITSYKFITNNPTFSFSLIFTRSVVNVGGNKSIKSTKMKSIQTRTQHSFFGRVRVVFVGRCNKRDGKFNNF